MYTLPLLLTFVGYCGGDKKQESENWLSTSDLENLVAPAIVNAACESTGHIKVTWNSEFETIATHLQVFRKEVASEDDFEKIDEITVDAGIYSNDVANNVYYIYRVKAIVRGDDDELQYVSPDFSPESNQSKATVNCMLVADTDPGLETDG